MNETKNNPNRLGSRLENYRKDIENLENLIEDIKGKNPVFAEDIHKELVSVDVEESLESLESQQAALDELMELLPDFNIKSEIEDIIEEVVPATITESETMEELVSETQIVLNKEVPTPQIPKETTPIIDKDKKETIKKTKVKKEKIKKSIPQKLFNITRIAILSLSILLLSIYILFALTSEQGHDLMGYKVISMQEVSNLESNGRQQLGLLNVNTNPHYQENQKVLFYPSQSASQRIGTIQTVQDLGGSTTLKINVENSGSQIVTDHQMAGIVIFTLPLLGALMVFMNTYFYYMIAGLLVINIAFYFGSVWSTKKKNKKI